MDYASVGNACPVDLNKIIMKVLEFLKRVIDSRAHATELPEHS